MSDPKVRRWTGALGQAVEEAARPASPSDSVGHGVSLDTALFALSAAGVPIGIFALRRLGRLGGLLLEVAGGALFVRAG
jgi:hypothetical protein